MKTGWKIFWLICGVLAVLGVAFCAVGAAMGGNVTSLGSRYVTWETGWGAEEDSGDTNDVPDIEEDAGISSEANTTEYANIRKLDVELTYIKVDITEYNGDTVKVQTTGVAQDLLQDISCYTEENKLKIEQKHHDRWKQLFNNADGDYGVMTIQIPENSLDEVQLSVGAGLLHIESIQAKELDIEVGAGYAQADDFTTEVLDLECGAGEVEIAGDAKTTDIECGMGEVTYQAAGSESDYSYSIECGIGSVDVGSSSYAGVASDKNIQNPGASRQIDVECGLGRVEVTFQE